MHPKCFQTLDNGQRCSALAIHGSRYCRHHDQQHPPKPASEESRQTAPLSLPLILDNPSALVALNQVVQALSDDRIKRSVAQTLLSAIKLANRLITEIAEAGLTTPLSNSPAHHFQETHNDDRLAVALAASSDPRQPNAFSATRPHSAFQPEVDPDTARIVKELVAQSHELARTQSQTARS